MDMGEDVPLADSNSVSIVPETSVEAETGGSQISPRSIHDDGLEGISVEEPSVDKQESFIYEDDGESVEPQQPENTAAVRASKFSFFHGSHKNVYHRLETFIMSNPVLRQRRVQMMRAFTIWSRLHPVNIKCDELKRQLQERASALTSVRDSYLRDVVVIKHNMNRLLDFSKPLLESFESAGTPREEIDCLPSVSLRQLVDTARTSLQPSSKQLQESLISAGLMDPLQKKALSPWERSPGKQSGRLCR
jgi:hypothetical protein